MNFRLTYAGQLLATREARNDPKIVNRSRHKHEIRQVFHRQLRKLWSEHPVLSRGHSTAPIIGSNKIGGLNPLHGFNWKPIVTRGSGLICALDILLLRAGPPSDAVSDIDNRLKTIFDALTQPTHPQQLCIGNSAAPITPQENEDPFYVLLEDDSLIASVSVITDMLLEPVKDVKENAARLLVSVTVKPYAVTLDNLDFA